MKRVMVLATVLMLTALLLSGCFNMTQEYTFEKDGSGKAMMDVGMSEGLIAMAQSSDDTMFDLAEIQIAWSDNPYASNIQVNEASMDDGYRHVTVSADVSDMAGFLQTWQQGDDGLMAITIETLDNGNVRYHQVIDLATNTSSSGNDEFGQMGAGMMADAMKDQFWTLRLHTPNMVDTNGEWDSKTKTVEWRIPIARLMNDKVEISAEFSLGSGLPTWLLIVTGIAILFLFIAASIVIVILLRHKGPKSKLNQTTND